MGKILSTVTKPIRHWNIENRAHKLIEKRAIRPPPKFESTLRDLERSVKENPNLLEELSKKDPSLDSHLKKVFVTSTDPPPVVRNRDPIDESETKTLPTDRTMVEDFEYGYKEPERIRPGRCTVRQATKFIVAHQEDPEKWTAARIAEEYKLKESIVANILSNFRSMAVYIPDKTDKKKKPAEDNVPNILWMNQEEVNKLLPLNRREKEEEAQQKIKEKNTVKNIVKNTF